MKAALLFFYRLYVLVRPITRGIRRRRINKLAGTAGRRAPEGRLVLVRVRQNPIISPSSRNPWESSAVFNPATIYLRGKVHFLYRAVGESGLSVFGYASSSDGVKIDERLDVPAFVSGKPQPSKPVVASHYSSGGSWWGCEDPRLSVIGDTVYMTYTAFDGCQPPCVALSSIRVDDFIHKKWNWTQPTVISAPGETNKNWTVFPEKINGRYAILHSITPKISIDYRDDLNFADGEFIASYYRSGGRESSWDNWVRGAGPPPVRIGDNWLLLYHAMDRNDPDKYKLGAMILDGKQPEKILYRADYPLLEPAMWYENEGYKRGVVYACGAVIVGPRLYVYYGGSDSYVCAATVDVDAVLARMTDVGPQPARQNSAPVYLKIA